LKKYFLAIILMCVVVAASGCSMYGTGSGTLTNETKSVNGVNQVYLDGIGTLVIQQGDKESLTIVAEDNIINHIESNVNGNKLELKYDSITPTPTKPVKYYLTIKDLNSLSLSGAGKAESNGLKTDNLTLTIKGAGEVEMSNVDLNVLTVNIDGAGEVEMDGRTNEQTVTINGAGEYDADELQSNIATITINGAGEGTLNVSKILNAFINGAGNIKYIGNPQLNKHTSGVGSIKQIT
jgi:hypothetical protein